MLLGYVSSAVLSLLLSLTLAQTPSLEGLDVLERQTIPVRQPTKLLSLPAEVLTKDGWSDEEAATIVRASSSSSTRSLVAGVVTGVLVGVGSILTSRLDEPTSVWVGVTSSLVSFAVLTLGVIWGAVPVTELLGLFEPRDQRLRKAAVSASDWDPVVVQAAGQLLGTGMREGKGEFLRGGEVVTEEQLATLSADPVAHARDRALVRSESTAAAVLLVVGGLFLCAPPVILGVTNLTPLGDLAVSLGSLGLSIVALLTAGPLATNAANREAAMLDRFNAAVFDEARKALAARRAAEPAPPQP